METGKTKRRTAAELLGVPPAPTNGRERIVHKAIDLFYRHGFHAVGLDRIIAETGVTKTTFYKHFESKDDLVVEAITRRHEWETGAWARAVQKIAGDDPRMQLLAVFDVLDEWFNAPDYGGCIFLNAAAEFADPREPAHQAAALHKRAVRDGWCGLARQAGAADPDAFADRYTALVEGTLIMRHVHGRNDAARFMKPLAESLLSECIPSATRKKSVKAKHVTGVIGVLVLLGFASSRTVGADANPLAGTKPVEIPANVYELQYRQTENLFLKRIADSASVRERRWQRDFTSPERYAASVEPNRAIVAKFIGVSERLPDVKVPPPTIKQIAAGEAFTTSEIEFQLYDDVRVDALLLIPTAGEGPFPVVIACHGDASSPESICGEAKEATERFAQTLAARGLAVIAPRFVPRASDHADAELYHKDLRHILHRMSYVLGKHPIGVDVDTVRTAIDAATSLGGKLDSTRVEAIGVGQGGMAAMYATALDSRVDSTVLIDSFDDRSRVYDEPADRAIFRHLVEFDDSDVCSLIAPRKLALAWSKPAGDAAAREQYALQETYQKLDAFSPEKVSSFESLDLAAFASSLPAISIRPGDEVEARRDKLYGQLKQHFHKMIEASAGVRAKRWASDARSPGEFEKASAKMRDAYLDLVGRCDFLQRVPLNPRSQKSYDTEEYVGYKILLDVFDGLEAYGVLLVPKGVDTGERRPVVICQHGFAGNPEKTIGPGDLDQYYHRFPHSLARRGYVTFTPYIVVPTEESEWRLDRRAKVVGESRAGVGRQQYAAIVDFLQQLDFVDAKRIGFQGLSYGGFTGLWVVSQEPRISPVIVAGYFSDWKARLFDDPKGYMPIRSECMYVWDQLNTFNHSDLAAMISPRPVFIEHGIEHGPNWMTWSGNEYKLIEAHYARLGIADRARFYSFPGGHETGTEEAFRFLDKWLEFAPKKTPTGVVFRAAN